MDRGPIAYGVALIAAGALALPGCALLGGTSGMSAAEIRATALEKDATLHCALIPTPWGIGRSVTVTLDRGVVPAGSVSVDTECRASITNAPLPR